MCITGRIKGLRETAFAGCGKASAFPCAVNAFSIGGIFLTFCDVSLKQKHTQQNKGGMTDTYNEDGTYLKSFYTVLSNPSCTVVAPMVNG